jgi:hypothetical protein
LNFQLNALDSRSHRGGHATHARWKRYSNPLTKWSKRSKRKEILWKTTNRSRVPRHRRIPLWTSQMILFVSRKKHNATMKNRIEGEEPRNSTVEEALLQVRLAKTQKVASLDYLRLVRNHLKAFIACLRNRHPPVTVILTNPLSLMPLPTFRHRVETMEVEARIHLPQIRGGQAA